MTCTTYPLPDARKIDFRAFGSIYDLEAKMALTVEKIAANAAKRVDSNKVGIDPLTVMTIFSVVVLPVLKCFMGNDEPDPVQVQAAVKERHERNPRALRRRTAAKLIAEAKQNGHKLSKDQSLSMADALIQETLSYSSDTVAAFCSSHKPE